jgi:PAS domain S-box-containing protein
MATVRGSADVERDRLFRLSQDLMCVAGVDGFFKETNPAFERVLGYTREELLTRNFISFIHPEDRDRTSAEVERLSRGELTIDFENRYRAKNGSYHWLAWRATPLPEERLIFAVARDVTAQKILEQRLEEQARDLARSNADIEQFAYVASHDLRAPLRAIENIAEWIEEDMPADLPDTVRGHLHELRRRVRRLQSMTDDLLEYSRAGTGPEASEPVDTSALVKEIADLLAPRPGFQVVAGAALPTIETMRTPLEQVVRNLIANALAHHDADHGRIDVDAVDRGGMVEFRVVDDGRGVPVEVRERIFQMFFRLAPESGTGSGLGLALARRLVERAGGRIWVEPAPGRGAAFCFTWPRRPGAGSVDATHPGR